MAQEYDASFKGLVSAYAADWVAFAGLPVSADVSVIDAEVSSVTAAADKVLRVGGPQPYIAHLEFQAGYDPALDLRMLTYNVLLRRRHALPVRSVAVLLHRKAQPPQVRGAFDDEAGSDCRLSFAYRLIRLWERPAASFVEGPIGTLPVAAATASAAELPAVLNRIAGRLRGEVPGARARELWSTTGLISGLQHDRRVVEGMMMPSLEFALRESSLYKAAVAEGVAQGRDEGREQGREQGRLEGLRQAVLVAGSQRLGNPDPPMRAWINAHDDAAALEALVKRTLTVNNWQELVTRA